ncbi:hypothetical protein A5761_15000 [Mycolicibacterium setense]|nr:hypothetical protein A5761_15000 [Mycolicibacterium setense]
MWSCYPDEIEADFEREYPGTNIGWWHRGDRDEHGCLKLSSRKFLNLIYRLSEASEFKTYAVPPFGRDGDWPEALQIAAATHNEIAAYRASKYVDTPHEYRYTEFVSPPDRRARAEEAAADEDDIEYALDACDE